MLVKYDEICYAYVLTVVAYAGVERKYVAATRCKSEAETFKPIYLMQTIKTVLASWAVV